MSLQATLDKILPELPETKPETLNPLRILLLDIETYPALTWQWSLWDKFTPVERIAREGGMLCWAAKWYADPDTITASLWDDGVEGMAERMHALMCEADAVVTYNGDRFDLPKLRTWVELDSGLGPVAPFKSVDLYHTVKHVGGGMLSKKLGYVTERLGIGAKVDHYGFQLWPDSMPTELGGLAKPEAQELMVRYCAGDVASTLEPLLDALLPWVKAFPHIGLYDESTKTNRCQRCAGLGRDGQLQSCGYAYTPLGKFKRYLCTACRSYSRGKTRVAGVDARSI